MILYLISPKILQLARGGFPFAWLVDVKVPAQWSQFHVPLASCKPRLDLEFRWEAFPRRAGRSRCSLFSSSLGVVGTESKGCARQSDISLQLVVKKSWERRGLAEANESFCSSHTQCKLCDLHRQLIRRHASPTVYILAASMIINQGSLRALRSGGEGGKLRNWTYWGARRFGWWGSLGAQLS